MNNQENLHNEEAVAKIKELATSIGTCMFATNLDEDRSAIRPMATTDVDDEGNLWFFTSIESDKVEEVYHDKDVQLIYAHPGEESYMNILGHAAVTRDKQKIDELWNPWAKAWFKDGKDDPRVALVKVTPDEAYYWDSKDGKMLLFAKMLAAAITGKNTTNTASGELKI